MKKIILLILTLLSASAFPGITQFKPVEGANVKFKTMEEVVLNTQHAWWYNWDKDSSTSCTLFFNLNKDAGDLSIEFSPECWLMLPLKVQDEKITVYWEPNIDTKYNFAVVKAINKIEKNYKGKPFMVLTLANDSTLKAEYPFPESRVRLNKSERKERVLFPDVFAAHTE